MPNVKKQPKIIVIVGPTASGKSALAVALAKRFHGEVISADSRQVYRGMDIGTGKVTRHEQGGIPHHLLDVVSPKRTMTVARYRTLGRAAIKNIVANNMLPVIVGGTGFYIDALLLDHTLPEVKPNLALRKKLERRTTEDLFEELQKRDPRRAATIDRHNRRRLVRALEIVMTTKRPVPELTGSAAPGSSSYDILKIGLAPSRATLEKNIGERLLKRLRKGMVREVQKLRAGGVSWKRLDDLGLEYRYVSRHLRGLISKDDMMRDLEREILHYAKRQMTWFKRDKTIHWIKNPAKAVALARKFLKK